MSMIPAFQYFMLSQYYMSFIFTIPIGVCAELLTYIIPRYKNTVTKIELDDTYGYCNISISNSKPVKVKIIDIKKPRDDQFLYFYWKEFHTHERLLPLYINNKRVYIDTLGDITQGDVFRAVINGININLKDN